ISFEENPATATINVTAVEVPELTEQEISDRLHLERKVERAFFEAGKALMELRDRRLYRSTHKTFEEYCRSRFGYTRMAATYKIAAATVMENLSTIGLQNAEITTDGLQPPKMSTIGLQNVEMSTIGLQILPTNERQVRPLVALEPEVQRTAWQQAVQVAGGKVPTGRIVKDVVQRIMERTQVPNTYQIGEVCQILAKDNPELRGKGGCWAIVSAINNFSCSVRMWNGEYAVGLQHLKSYDYLPAECEQMREICDRISRVYSSGLEDSVQKFLEMLGKLNRAYLTALEEKLLTVLESESETSETVT
ncbi:MAG: hypothetical protein V7L30_31780, partial [Nostoc sp.]|uniref:hypothetical protein n=1 Tax=Nostoc sp. TaxID=1180 RepID=UPI002FF61AEB